MLGIERTDSLPEAPQPKPRRLKIGLIDTTPLLHRALEKLLTDSSYEVVALRGGRSTISEQIEGIPPHLLLVVLGSRSDPLEWKRIAKELSAKRPQTRIIVAGHTCNAAFVSGLLKAGVDGYVLTHRSPEEIAHAIEDVIHGFIHVDYGVLPQECPRSDIQCPKSA